VKRLLNRRRRDDQEEAILKRLRWYAEEVMPTVKYYREKGMLVEVNGEQSVESVSKEILEKLKHFLAS